MLFPLTPIISKIPLLAVSPTICNLYVRIEGIKEKLIATLDKILSDVGAISEKITIDSSSGISTNKKTVIFSGDSDRGEARVTMDADDDKSKVELLEEITVKENSKSTYNIDFISKIIRAIGHQSSNLVTIEYSSNKPLRLEFLLSGMVKLQFYLAPRVQD